MIESYTFGRIVVDGRTYQNDVLIFPDGTVDPEWWREQGHALTQADIAALLETNPELLIIGTGASGMLVVDPECEAYLEALGIEYVALPTARAVAHYNASFKLRSTAAGLHLTC